MHWIYVLQCENDTIYIGETVKLFKRLREHYNGGKSINTSLYKPKKLISLYKVGQNYEFHEYLKKIEEEGVENRELRKIVERFDIIVNKNKDYALKVENFFAEMHILYGNCTIRGGKYTKGLQNQEKIKNEIDEISLGMMKSRPKCHCGYFSEIRKENMGKKFKLYFVCCMKNVWSSMREDLTYFEIAPPCTFYQEYLDDIDRRIEMYKE